MTRTVQRKKGESKGFSDYLPTVNDFDSEYEYDLYMSQYPLIGGFYGRRAQRLAYEENKRYNSDRASHLGYDLSDNPYPIRSGYYSRYADESFEVTEAIMALYGIKKFW